tara:strand:+ start:176 stop:655 length:480 start_codon:yes stop_codon:yes gene_type:complete
MKRTILLFFAIVGIISCTENDTLSNNHNQADSGSVKHNDPQDKSLSDRIIGEWQLESIHFEPVRDLATECQKKSTYKFNEDGTITGIVYSKDIGKKCSDKLVNSTWKNIDSSNYYFLIDNSIKHVTFSQDNNSIIMRSKTIEDKCIFNLFGNQNTYKRK